MKDSLKALLCDLSKIHAVSGFEREMARYTSNALEPLADSVMVDRYGNVVATCIGTSPGPTLMLAAHQDEIGLIIKAVKATGFLRVEKLGRFPDSMLPGRRVWINGHFGLIGVKAGHLQTAVEQSRVVPGEDLYIDVGANKAEEVAAMGIRIGDPVAYLGELETFTNSDRVCLKACDNRVGCAILIQLFRELQGKEFAGTLYGVGTVLEEVGLRGTQMVAFRLNPDIAIAIDGQPAADTPDASLTQTAPVALSRGATINLAMGTQGIRGGIIHPAVKAALIRAAEKARVPYQLCTSTLTGSTDAAAIYLVREGIPTGTVWVPRRYSYSPDEIVDLNDIIAAVKLLEQFVLDLVTVNNIGIL